jgi:hypothetical protein
MLPYVGATPRRSLVAGDGAGVGTDVPRVPDARAPKAARLPGMIRHVVPVPEDIVSPPIASMRSMSRRAARAESTRRLPPSRRTR